MEHTPLELSRLAAERLGRAGVEDARLESELLLAAVLGCRRLDLYLQFERPLTEAEVERYRDALRRRLRREPLQYVVGEAEFREVKLKVDRRALIPRPETEVLVGAVLEWARAAAAVRDAADAEGLRALDVGTGTGAIAISLVAEGGFASVVATDDSADALSLAAENVAACGVDEWVELRQGALFEPLEADERFDAVVSNPPYIAEAEREALAPEVREWEPEQALFAGRAGRDVIDALVAGAASHLRPGGLLALEVGATQARDVAGSIAGHGGYGSVRVLADLTGRERVVLATMRIAKSEERRNE